MEQRNFLDRWKVSLVLCLPLLLLSSGCSSWRSVLPVEVKTVEVERKIPLQTRPSPVRLNDIHFYVVTEQNFEEFKNKFDKNVPRPKHWGGFKIVPNEFEFWQDGDFRLHDRFILKPSDHSTLWECQRYYP